MIVELMSEYIYEIIFTAILASSGTVIAWADQRYEPKGESRRAVLDNEIAKLLAKEKYDKLTQTESYLLTEFQRQRETLKKNK
ncbi:MAG: hypothetical protein AAGA80_28095 [Cyanobacteria bacterium P01_F01_bin.143]